MQQLGPPVKVISPQVVKPYGKGKKNDRRDAAAICEAVARAQLRVVPLKTGESQDIQARHRVRRRVMPQRPAVGNHVRGLLAERGILRAQGSTQGRKQLPGIVEEVDNVLTSLAREVLRE